MSVKSNNIVRIVNAFNDDKDRVAHLISKIAAQIEAQQALSEQDKFFAIMLTFRHDLSEFTTKEAFCAFVNERAKSEFEVNSASDFRKSVSTALNISNYLFACRNVADDSDVKISKKFDSELKDKFVAAKKNRALTINARIIDSYESVMKNLRCRLRTFRISKDFTKFFDENLTEEVKIIESRVLLAESSESAQ